MNKTKLMIVVTYLTDPNDEDSDNFEIFDSIHKARRFATMISKGDKSHPVKAYAADLDSDFIYQERNEWNYEDVSGLIVNSIDLNLNNTCPSCAKYAIENNVDVGSHHDSEECPYA